MLLLPWLIFIFPSNCANDSNVYYNPLQCSEINDHATDSNGTWICREIARVDLHTVILNVGGSLGSGTQQDPAPSHQTYLPLCAHFIDVSGASDEAQSGEEGDKIRSRGSPLLLLVCCSGMIALLDAQVTDPHFQATTSYLSPSSSHHPHRASFLPSF